MLLSRTDSSMGTGTSTLSFQQPAVRRQRVCLSGTEAEPTVPIETLTAALTEEDIEHFRPLLPVGYHATAAAYQSAVDKINADTLTSHYTQGIDFFQQEFIPYLKNSLMQLTGGAWDLHEYVGYAAGSDVDLMTHIIEAVAAEKSVSLFPGDWYGFLVGASQVDNIHWTTDSHRAMACLCIPSVRNGLVTQEMFDFLEQAQYCLLNINLYPTLPDEERYAVATQLNPILEKSILSVSFSRGFGLTASQLGVILIHRQHPLRKRFDTQWRWFSYYFNAIAAHAYMALDKAALQQIDQQRRQWVHDWLHSRQLPVINTGSYYVKSFRPQGTIPDQLAPLMRDNVLRLCFKPQYH